VTVNDRAVQERCAAICNLIGAGNRERTLARSIQGRGVADSSLDQATTAVSQSTARNNDAIFKIHIVTAADCLNRSTLVVELAAAKHEPARSGGFQKPLVHKAS